MMLSASRARRGLFALLFSALCAGPAAGQAEDSVDTISIPEGGFRTEADDLAEMGEQEEAGQQLGQLGAVTIPFTMPYDGQATVALYSQQGQLVRILGQALRLTAGDYYARWDGMDLFGNLVPADTQLELKVVTTRGLKALYQFTVGHGNPAQPFGGRYENEQGERRQGGWLGDHSTPNAAVAVGDHVALGCFLAEAGGNMILLNNDYEVIWSSKLAGWSGPAKFRSDGENLFALLQRGAGVYRIEPFNFDPRGRLYKKQIINPGRDSIISFAAGQGKIIALHRNSQMDISHFRNAASGGNIDNTKSQPQVIGGKAPTEFHIGPVSAFKATFTGGGHPQAGAKFHVKGDYGYIVLPFHKPITFGSSVIARMGGVDRVEIFALKEGLVYDALKHSPVKKGDDAANLLADVGMNLDEFDENWEKVAETDLDDTVNFLTPKQRVTTGAVYLRSRIADDNDRRRAGLKLAQFIAEPTEILDIPAKLTIQEQGIERARVTGTKTRPGISVDTTFHISREDPLRFVIDYDQPQTFDGLLFFNPLTPRVEIEKFVGTGNPSAQMNDDQVWEPLTQFRGGRNRKLGSLVSAKTQNAQIVRLQYRTQASALRFRVIEGYKTGKYSTFLGGKGGKRDDDPMWAEIDNIALLHLPNRPADPPERILATYDAKTGKQLATTRGTEGFDIQTMALGPDGTLYTVVDGRLHTTVVEGDRLAHTPLADQTFERASDLTVSADRIAVTDADAHKAYIFDTAGTLIQTIGDGTRAPGPWNNNWLGKPNGIALASDGKVWIAESNFAPKRVSVFDANGTHQRNLLGPTMYGGGGQLDPNLKSFFYRGVEYALDFEAGTSTLKAINDRAYDDNVLGMENGTFSFTGLGSPYYHDGKRYIVGYTNKHYVTAKHPHTDTGQRWTPAVVMGPAEGSNFLLAKPSWRDHWANMELTDRYFIWVDRNDNQQYEIDEVEMMHADEWEHGERPPTGGTIGAGFVLHGGRKWAPDAFTPGGVPVFSFAGAAKAPKFYSRDAIPHYPRNYTLGSQKSAKPYYGDFKHITDDGKLIREGQPFVVMPDGSVMGGTPPTSSGFIPRIDGTVLNQPWRFTGGARTESPVGYVAMVNSNNGYWYAWAADLGVIVATLFDGTDGGWHFPAKRGHDAAGAKHAWESWGGDFIKSHDGGYYTVAGKTFHAICKIEGLDDFDVATKTITVEPNHHQVNTALRPIIIQRDRSRVNVKNMTLEVPRADKRTRGIKVDGLIEEWGSPHKMNNIGPTEKNLLFDLARDEKGLYIVLFGKSRMTNEATDPTRMFHDGFSFDIMVRGAGKSGARDVLPGDKRFVFGKLDGEWAAVVFDYKAKDAEGEPTVYDSAAARVEVAKVARLSKDQVTMHVRGQALGINLDTLSDVEALEDAPTLPGSIDAVPKNAPGDAAVEDDDLNTWTAEVFLPWETLGVSGEFRFDIAVNSAKADGKGVAERHAWSDQSAGTVGDIGIEATLNPQAWGLVRAGR